MPDKAELAFDQRGFAVRCEWGAAGVARLGPISDVVVIVDVLSFSTSVDIAHGRGAAIFPYPWRDDSTSSYAASVQAELPSRFNLSPSSLRDIPSGTRLLLPSPNGSELSFRASLHTTVLAGCLRNARAVAQRAQSLGDSIAVIPAGERWPDGSLRPCVEDWLGAGAILGELTRGGVEFSAEARQARDAFNEQTFRSLLDGCLSAEEKLARNQAEDVALAGLLNVSSAAPLMRKEHRCFCLAG